MIDYEKQIARINARSNPDNLQRESHFVNEMREVKYGNAEKYIRLAMHGVEPAYTAKIREAGDKVKVHLGEVLTEVSFKYQGSVETNTHIVATSDIDLLVITNEFLNPDYSDIKGILGSVFKKQQLSHPQIALLESAIGPPYLKGDSNEVLKRNRLRSEKKLRSVYKHCNVDKGKAIQITNQSLKKEVDIVIAKWFDNAASILNGKLIEFRGIQIYDYNRGKGKGKCGDPDFPFLKIKLLNDKSSLTNGRLKRMIRFLKNIKAQLNDGEVEQIAKLKSFQFNAICYEMEINEYKDKSIFQLVAVVYFQLESLYENETHRNSLMAVDGRENIFKEIPEAKGELKLLMDAILPILMDLKKQGVL